MIVRGKFQIPSLSRSGLKVCGGVGSKWLLCLTSTQVKLNWSYGWVLTTAYWVKKVCSQFHPKIFGCQPKKYFFYPCLEHPLSVAQSKITVDIKKILQSICIEFLQSLTLPLKPQGSHQNKKVMELWKKFPKEGGGWGAKVRTETKSLFKIAKFSRPMST